MDRRAQYLHKLETIDWEFPVPFSGTSQILHWYPETFRPELPATLIEAFTGENDLVFDPYGGVGTAGGEAIRAGRRALITEHNLVGAGSAYVLIGLLLLKAFDQPLLDRALAMVETLVSAPTEMRAMAALSGVDNEVQRALDDCIDDFMRPAAATFLSTFRMGPPRWSLLKPWFEANTLEQVKRAVASVEAQEGAFCKLLGLIAISAVLRPCSSRTRSWWHIAANALPREYKEKSLPHNLGTWLGRVRKMLRTVEIAEVRGARKPRAMVIWHNWAHDLAEPSQLRARAHLLVTSPPYANMIDYTLSQRLSHYLLGCRDKSLSKLVQGEIGARRKRFTSTRKISWSEEIKAALIHQMKHVRSDGYVALVLPNSGDTRDINMTNIASAMEKIGWNVIFEADRSIKRSRPWKYWPSIKKEMIYVFSSIG